jgi:hypothetical protein
MARQDRLAIAFISLGELVTMSSMCLKTRASLTSRLSWALAGAVDSGGAVDGDALPFVVFTAFIVFIEVFLLFVSMGAFGAIAIKGMNVRCRIYSKTKWKYNADFGLTMLGCQGD